MPGSDYATLVRYSGLLLEFAIDQKPTVRWARQGCHMSVVLRHVHRRLPCPYRPEKVSSPGSTDAAPASLLAPLWAKVPHQGRFRISPAAHRPRDVAPRWMKPVDGSKPKPPLSACRSSGWTVSPDRSSPRRFDSCVPKNTWHAVESKWPTDDQRRGWRAAPHGYQDNGPCDQRLLPHRHGRA